MSDFLPQPIIVVEGNDDRAILETLHGAGVLPPGVRIVPERADASFPSGREGMLKRVVAFLKAGVAGLVVLRDIDREDDIGTWLTSHIGGQPGLSVAGLQDIAPQVHGLEVQGDNGVSRVAVLGAGLPTTDALMAEFGITLPAIDDFLLRLVCKDVVFSAMNDVNHLPHGLAIAVLKRLLATLRENGIEVSRSKRLLQVLHAVTGFRASSAVFAAAVMQSALQILRSEERTLVLSPLLTHLTAALDFVSPREGKTISQ